MRHAGLLIKLDLNTDISIQAAPPLMSPVVSVLKGIGSIISI